MSQTLLPFEFAAAPLRPALRLRRSAVEAGIAGGVDAIGFEIGWDHARHALTPPLAHLHDGNPVRQGWAAARTAFGRRTLRATPQVRLWLQLRLAAWRQGAAFEAVQVTPHFLAQIGAANCPVTREPLACSGSDGGVAAVERINRGAAFAAGNLATIGTRAAGALAGCSWRQALETAQRVGRGESGGLDTNQWQRLGVLMSFVTPLPHAQAGELPLSVLPPNRLRVLNPVQALQVMLTQLFTAPGYARRMLGLAALMPCAASRHALRLFMHTLLARRIAAGASLDRTAARWAMEDSWSDALVVRRWRSLARLLTETGCEQLLERAARRGLAPAGSRWVDTRAATDGWALDRGGYVDCAAMSRTPGIERSLGSQKLAS